MGAAILAMRARGIDPMQSGLGVTLMLNLVITFLIPGISKGGHVGGLVAGGIIGYLLFEIADRRRWSDTTVIAVGAVLGVALAVGCVIAAQTAPSPSGFG
jgi:membrane associated rhomboid family serine protease